MDLIHPVPQAPRKPHNVKSAAQNGFKLNNELGSIK